MQGAGNTYKKTGFRRFFKSLSKISQRYGWRVYDRSLLNDAYEYG